MARRCCSYGLSYDGIRRGALLCMRHRRGRRSGIRRTYGNLRVAVFGLTAAAGMQKGVPCFIKTTDAYTFARVDTKFLSDGDTAFSFPSFSIGSLYSPVKIIPLSIYEIPVGIANTISGIIKENANFSDSFSELPSITSWQYIMKLKRSSITAVSIMIRLRIFLEHFLIFKNILLIKVINTFPY